MKIAILVLVLIFSFFAQSATSEFTYTGKMDTTERRVYYSIPESAAEEMTNGKKLKTLIFLHGGGEETATPETAQAVAKRYLADFASYSEKNKVLLIFPTSHIGWNIHTRYFLTEFVADLPTIISSVDTDSVVLAGHSMGAMGITREFPYIHSLFSGVLALAGGTQPQYATEQLLLTYFDTRYIHINGDLDRFSDFKPLMLEVQKKITSMESALQKLSRFTLEFHPGGHNYDHQRNEVALEELFALKKSEIRKEFTAFFESRNLPNLVPALNDAAITQAFWVKATKFTHASVDDKGRFNMIRGQVFDNIVEISIVPVGNALTLEITELEINLNGLIEKSGTVPVIKINGAQAQAVESLENNLYQITI